MLNCLECMCAETAERCSWLQVVCGGVVSLGVGH